jgi:CheY-like chemotaxis protein
MQMNVMRDDPVGHAKTSNVLIVEDNLIIAMDLEDMVSRTGLNVVGLASSRDHAIALAAVADIALVDVNLSDGVTGPEVGRVLANEFGVTVVFMTGNAEVLAGGIEGTLGVVSKPVNPNVVTQTLEYAMAKRNNQPAVPPLLLKVFAQ